MLGNNTSPNPDYPDLIIPPLHKHTVTFARIAFCLTLVHTDIDPRRLGAMHMPIISCGHVYICSEPVVIYSTAYLLHM